jgi:hypothetical protein
VFWCNSKYDKKRNGTDRHYESLRKSYANSRERPEPTVSIWKILARNQQYVVNALHAETFFHAERVIIWDTECDAVGGGYELEQIREWYLLKVHSGKTARQLFFFHNSTKMRIINR